MTKTKYVGKIDENQIISDAIDYIMEETGDKVIVHTDDSYDPENKAEMQCLTNQLFLWNRVKNLISFTYFF